MIFKQIFFMIFLNELSSFFFSQLNGFKYRVWKQNLEYSSIIIYDSFIRFILILKNKQQNKKIDTKQ